PRHAARDGGDRGPRAALRCPRARARGPRVSLRHFHARRHRDLHGGRLRVHSRHGAWRAAPTAPGMVRTHAGATDGGGRVRTDDGGGGRGLTPAARTGTRRRAVHSLIAVAHWMRTAGRKDG